MEAPWLDVSLNLHRRTLDFDSTLINRNLNN